MTLSRKLAQIILKKDVKVQNLIEVLSTYNLLSMLPLILKDVKQITKNKNLNDTVLIESPFEVSDEAVAKIKRIVGNDLASHEVTINKNLLAGFKARFKGKLYDGSAERILKQLVATSQ